jgi:hypothetical protein
VGGGAREQAFQHAGAAGAGTNDGGPDALRIFHGIQTIRCQLNALPAGTDVVWMGG